MFKFIRGALTTAICVLFFVGLVYGGILGEQVSRRLGSSTFLGILLGVGISFFIETISLGTIITIIVIAETNEAILEKLNELDIPNKKAIENISSKNIQPDNDSWLCPNCGSMNPEYTKICTNCGK